MSLILAETAAKILSLVREGKGSIKTLCYDQENQKLNKKALYGIVCECCKHYYALEAAVRSSQDLVKIAEKDDCFWMVLLFEFVSKTFRYDLNNKTIQTFWKYRLDLASAYSTALKRFQPFEDTYERYKYMRVNRLIDADELPETFVEVKTLEIVEKKENAFMRDPHVRDLIALSPKSNISLLPGYKNGALISQDKASCIPALILNPPLGAHVIDCCAAPGNKTTQLAGYVGSEGKVFAIEKDEKRFETLRKMVKRGGADKIVECHNRDFLNLDPHLPKYRAVEYALVDPSCSGSGMSLSLEKHVEAKSEIDRHRLKHLSNFQTMAVKKAMSFPRVQRVVYSTCSIHEEENEMVVREILESMPEWRLATNPLPSWPRRGVEKYAFHKDVIRADPEKDRMTGFFVALFERKTE